MKKKFKKRILALFLLAIVLSNSLSTLISAHTHTYVFTNRYTLYDSLNSSTHRVTIEVWYKCSCGDLDYDTSTYTASHVFPAYQYSGYNYHSGSKHYFEMARYCNYCNYKDAYFSERSCSGPPCTIPY